MSSSRTVLLTGFEPFAGMDHNPSWDVVAELAAVAERQGLHAQQVHGALAVRTALLPVEFSASAARLLEQITACAPDLVIAVGLAAGTEAVRLERVGLNLRDARIPDNAGHQPTEEPVVSGGQPALFSTLRLKSAHAAIGAAGIPVALSLSAGSFVCNSLLYSLLHTVPTSVPAGFVHVPDLTREDSPVSRAQAVQALDLLITESLRPEPDLQAPGGQLH
ncbi:pyroglutamyl-peptidase I [Nesterenkonia sp. CF4.4]|uniref:pyroglutamyl-peptidase I family protein n=1 Tax=Nesterenkonia sp. CF4.4 TaxID=3373079 RepID=UPI003EE68280